MPISSGTTATATCLDSETIVEQFHPKIEMQIVNIKRNHAQSILVLTRQYLDIRNIAQFRKDIIDEFVFSFKDVIDTQFFPSAGSPKRF